MKRRLNTLAPLLLAMLVVGAVAAQSALAEEEFFHSHAESTVITAQEDPAEPSQVFTIKNAGGEVKAVVSCEEKRLEGLVSGTEHNGETLGATYTTQEATVHPEYFACASSIGGSTIVLTNGCHTLLSGTDNEHGEAAVNCGAGAIEVKTEAGCVIKVGSQNLNSGSASYENDKSGSTQEWSVTVTVAATSVSYSSNFICQLAGIPKEGKNAEFVGSVVARGFEYQGGVTGEYEESAQVGIWFGPAE